MQTSTKIFRHAPILLAFSQPNIGMCLKLNCNQANAWHNHGHTGIPSLTSLCFYASKLIRYVASNVIFAIHSDASYLSEQGSKRFVDGNYFLTSDNPATCNNGAILTLKLSDIWHLLSCHHPSSQTAYQL